MEDSVIVVKKRFIELQVGAVLIVADMKLICVLDGVGEDGVYHSCGYCPLRELPECDVFMCGLSRWDHKKVHFEKFVKKRKGGKMSKLDVAIGAHVVLNGKTYECVRIRQKGSQHYDCGGCDLVDLSICNLVSCTGDFRKDGWWVVYKEVKE